ncbi:MAG: hypothetical protein K1X89_12580 [Myxococcaceae bacterium]|nr:hypothetical protein [Myxococcaceae bacterium]
MKALTAVLLVGCACATARVPRIGEPPPVVPDAAVESAYQAQIERVSARGAVYDGLDTRVFVAATVQTPAFVEARVRRSGSFKALPAAEVEANLASEQARLSDMVEVVFGVHCNEPKFDDFDKPSSIWRLTLSSGAQELAPREVKRMGRASLDLRSIYPYLDTFWVAYVARFPRPAEEPGAYQLRIASSLGKAELELHTR